MKQQFRDWQQVALAMLSGALMAIPFLAADWFALTWFALLPLLLAIDGAGLTRSWLLGLTAGLVFSMIAGYWIVDFAVIAMDYSLGSSLLPAFVLWFAGAQVTALIALALNGLRALAQRWFAVHDFVLIPLVFAMVYGAIPMLFPFHPADTQSRFLSALQAIELTGRFGLDATIGLVNAMLFHGLVAMRSGVSRSLRTATPWALASAIVVTWFAYGALTVQHWDRRIADWKTVTIGIVQPNEAPSRNRPRPWPGYSPTYPPEMAMTERLISAGAQLVVWPETRYKGYFDEPRVQAAWARQLTGTGAHLLFHDLESTADRENGILQYNAAVMIRADGNQLPPYRKMITMPFGEALPLNGAIPLLNSLTHRVLGDFIRPMGRGTEHARFSAGDLNIVPLICYETMFPDFVASALSNPAAGTLLVGLSNNAWFGETTQPLQHTNASILRAVENRVPFIHVVNNGPSMVALPNGRLIFTSDFRQAGGYLVDVPYLDEQ